MMKRLGRWPLNLQMFAVDKDGVEIEEDPGTDPGDDDQDETQDDLEVDFGDDGEEDEDLDDESDEESEDEEPEDDQDDPVDDKGADDKGKNPTAAAVIAERKKWQEKLKAQEQSVKLAEKIMKQAGINDAAEMERRLDLLEADRLQKQGVAPEVAAAMVAQQKQLTEMQESIRRAKYDGEVERLKKDPFFSDIDDHREELEGIADRTGLTMEQAYRALHGDRRMKEREAEIEARVKANRTKRDSKRVNTAPSAGGKKPAGNTYGLSPDQLAAAKFGVKKGHFKSVEEYAKLLPK